MVSTRAGKKREAASSGPAQPAKKSKKLSRTKASKKSSEIQETASVPKKKPIGLLDMPAELRNRIYDFAVEVDIWKGWEVPVPIVRHKRNSEIPMFPGLSARNFLGLTQTCKLIRHEYRPIWLRNSSIRVLPEQLLYYIHTFYGCYHHGIVANLPKLIQLSYDLSENMLDLTQMFRLYANHLTTKFEFIPHELTLDEGTWNDDPFCPLCEDLGSESEFTDCEVDHEEYRRMAYADYLLGEEYPFLSILNALLRNDNVNFLADIREHEISRIELDMRDDWDLEKISILFTEDSAAARKLTRNKNMSIAAKNYVKDRGLTGGGFRYQLMVCSYAY